jgi:hypothetical protein
VPFCGTGSEIIGAIRAGWEEIVGIELNQNYFELCCERVSSFATEESVIAADVKQLALL